MEALSLVCTLFGALVLDVDAAPYFRWGDARQDIEVRSRSWTDEFCFETACPIQICIDEIAVRGTGPDRTAILRRSGRLGDSLDGMPLELWVIV